MISAQEGAGGQSEGSEDNFYEIQEAFNTYRATLPEDSINHEIKTFMRFEAFWENRVGIDDDGNPGSFSAYSKAIYELQDNICENNQNPKPWELIGPLNYSLHSMGIVTAVWMDPDNNNVVIAGTRRSGIWKTTNGGETWQNKTDNLRVPGLGITDFAVSGSTIYASTGINGYTANGSAYGAGILKSTNGGDTWEQMETLLSAIEESESITGLEDPFKTAFTSVDVDPTNPNKIMAGTNRTIFKSADGGDIWTASLVPNAENEDALIKNHFFMDMGFTPGQGDTLFASSWYINRGNGGAELWRTYNFGNSWEDLTSKLPLPDPIVEGFGSGWIQDDEWILQAPYTTAKAIPPVNGSTVMTRSIPMIGAHLTYNMKFNYVLPPHTQLKVFMVNILGDDDVPNIIFDEANTGSNTVSLSADFSFLSDTWYAEKILISASATEGYDGTTYLELSDFIYSFGAYETILIDVPEPGVVYVLAKLNNSTFRRVYKSLDYGDTYQFVTNVNLNYIERKGFEVADVNSNIFYAGANVAVKYNGTSFETLYEYNDYKSGAGNHPDVRAMQYFKKNGHDVLIIGNDGGVSVTYDAESGLGTSWTSLNGDSLAITEFFAVGTSEMNANRFIGGAIDNQTYAKIDSKWTKLHDGGDGNISVIDRFNPNLFYGKSNYALKSWLYTDMGFIDAPTQAGQPDDSPTVLNTMMKMDPNIPNKLFAIYPKGCFVKIVEPENSWTNITLNLPSYKGLYRGLDIYEQNSDIIYIARQGAYWSHPERKRVYRSDDGGNTWDETLAQVPTAHYKGITDLLISPYNPNLVLLSHGSISNAMGQKRVSRTEDAGNSWTDWSKGLPRIPANSLAYQKGNDIVYLATDAGVYFRHIDDDETNGLGWQCFNDGLPVCTVTDVDVNHCSQELIISTFGRGLWKTALIPMEDLVISEDTDWNDNMDIYSNVVVTNGAWLTITGTVNIAAGKSITIEPGARIDLNGGTITNACGELWDGIYVEGNKNEIQNTLTQGYIRLRNGATIENAYTAVRNWGRKANGDKDWSKTGGIIKAYDSYFINNRWDVSFLTYRQYYPNGTPKPDKSIFIDCDFIDNDNFVYDSNPERAFGMYRVHNIKIKGCTFSDNRIGLSNFEKSRGIDAVEAYYTIDNSPDSISEFNHLKYAARSYDYNLKSIVIQNTGFDCYQAIYLNGISDAKVNFNNFIVDTENPLGIEIIPQYGLYLDMCHSYEVEENTFNSNVDATGELAVGVLVNNRHGEVSMIKNNTFDNFYVATEAVGQNKNPDEFKGLEFRCNNYSNNKYDVFVTPDYNNPGPVVGIAYHQGELVQQTDKLAGNLFGNDSPVLQSNYLNKGDFLFYIHHNELSESRVVPSEYSNIALTPVSLPFNPALSCPPQNTGGGGGDEIKIAALKTTAETSASEVVQIDNQLATLVDGGNTEAMENDVILTDNADAWRKYQELMASAGYLSDEVLDEVSKKETGFNKAMIRNVLVANPQAAKSEKVQENLDNRGDQLPDYMRDQIDMGLTKMSAKEYLELVKATHQTRHYRAIDQLVMLLKRDTLNDRSAEIVAALSNTGNVAFDYKLVEYYDAHNQSDLASVLLEVIDGYNLSDVQQQYFDNYSAFRNLTAQWKQAGVNMAELDSTKLQELKAYSELNNSVAAKTIALQRLNGENSYTEPVYDPEGGEKSNTRNHRKRTEVTANNMLLFPNPADGYFTVEYSLTEPFNKAVLVVFDMSGKLVLQNEVNYSVDQVIIPTDNWPAGQYTCTLFADGQTILTRKITIAK